MKRILYSNGSFVTGDRIADAVLDYAAVLARAGSADHVRVPGLGPDDRVRDFDLVIGPASQILAERAETMADEIGNEEFVSEVRRRSEALDSLQSRQVWNSP